MDNLNNLRILSGINNYASEYSLKPQDIFRTPEFIFTFSAEGKGKASRDFHKWARKYQVKDGDKPRMTLLNNWEATYFDFDEDKLVDSLWTKPNRWELICSCWTTDGLPINIPVAVTVRAWVTGMKQ